MSERTPHTIQRTLPPQRPRRKITASWLIGLLIIVWLLFVFPAVVIAYLVTKDSAIVVLWTTFAALATSVFTYFFRRK